MAAIEGRVLGGRYELRWLLGLGGMGEVWAAEDLRLHRQVAVKLLSDAVSHQAGVRERFDAEGRAAARLTSPHVVTVHDVGEEAGTPYLVMECLPGRTLADEIADGPLPVERVRTIGGDVLAALDAAHRAGIVHRDVKPANVLFTEAGAAKVADFGIAGGTGLDLTRTGEVIGTAAYLAPERLEGRPATAESDLYAVGVVLYEALAGAKPYAADTPVGMALAMRSGDHVPLSQRRSDVDLALATAIERAMATDPAQRFGSAAAMAAALRGATAAPPAATAILPSAPARHRSPLVPALVGAGLVLAVLLVALLLSRSDDDADDGPTPPPSLDDSLDRLDETVGR